MNKKYFIIAFMIYITINIHTLRTAGDDPSDPLNTDPFKLFNKYNYKDLASFGFKKGIYEASTQATAGSILSPLNLLLEGANRGILASYFYLTRSKLEKDVIKVNEDKNKLVVRKARIQHLNENLDFNIPYALHLKKKIESSSNPIIQEKYTKQYQDTLLALKHMEKEIAAIHQESIDEQNDKIKQEKIKDFLRDILSPILDLPRLMQHTVLYIQQHDNTKKNIKAKKIESKLFQPINDKNSPENSEEKQELVQNNNPYDGEIQEFLASLNESSQEEQLNSPEQPTQNTIQ